MNALVVEMEDRLCPARGQAALRFTTLTVSISLRDPQVSLEVVSNGPLTDHEVTTVVKKQMFIHDHALCVLKSYDSFL